VASKKDELITLPHNRYGEYLEYVYNRMVQWVGSGAHVMEVGVRPTDRGVLSRRIIPHITFRTVDRRASRRPDLVCDVLKAPIQTDVIISTCILHHTAEKDIPLLLSNLRAPILLLTGPNVAVMKNLIGDHKWHIAEDLLRGWLEDLGYTVRFFPSGLSIPYCELLVVAEK